MTAKTLKEIFPNIQFPTKKHDNWKYINLKPLLETEFSDVVEKTTGVTHETLAPFYFEGDEKAKLISVNGHFSSDLSSVSELPKGVVVSSLADAFKNHETLLKEHELRFKSEQINPFASMNADNFSDGFFCYVPKDTKVSQPIHFLIVNSGDNKVPSVTYPRIVFIAESGAMVNVTTTIVDLKKSKTFTNIVGTYHVGDNATCHVTTVNHGLNENGVTFATSQYQIHSGATMRSIDFNYGDGISRNETDFDLKGENITAYLNGLALLTNKAQVYMHATTDHLTPNSVARQLLKSVLSGDAISEFDSMAYIHEKAFKSDSGQMLRNLVLSDKAVAHSRPQLKVYCDDVIAGHGSTIGQLDPHEVFYLMSRGLSREVAQSLLMFGFAEEVVEEVPIEGLKTKLIGIITNELERL